MCDGGTYERVEPGFELAPGDENDIAVCNAHSWSSSYDLVFADGYSAKTLWGLEAAAKEQARKPCK
jgi:hypothetical protein